MPVPFLNQIVCGDACKLLKKIPRSSVDLVITSPPYYEMRDYGSHSYNEYGNEPDVELYMSRLESIFHESVRIIKKTGSIVINLGDKYKHSSLMLIPYKFAIQALSWNPTARLINNITWIKTNPTPRQFNRRAVSSTEPFFHFVKDSSYKYYPEALDDNIPESLKKISSNVSSNYAKRYFYFIDGSDLTESEKNNAKIALQAAIDEVKSGKIAGLRMKIRGVHALPFGGQPGGRLTQIEKNGFTIIKLKGGKMHRDVIECPVATIPGIKHSAIYPSQIVEHFIKLTTDENDIVVDPFVGSGTSCIVAKGLGRQFIGFDINQDFVNLANERLND